MKIIIINIIELVYGPLSTIISAQLVKIVLLLVAVAYFTIAERKVMAAIQRRKGPNYVGV
jgi:NADH-quinone oxidoreductase subunit H